jgi:hypothetical protein
MASLQASARKIAETDLSLVHAPTLRAAALAVGLSPHNKITPNASAVKPPSDFDRIPITQRDHHSA